MWCRDDQSGQAYCVLMPEAAQRQGRYREVMHRAINAYKLLVVDEISKADPGTWHVSLKQRGQTETRS